MFSIDQFKANIAKSGIAKPSLFRVLVSRPTTIGGGASLASEQDMVYRIESADFPVRYVQSEDILVYGLAYPVARSAGMADQNISIIASSDLREKIYFEEWIDNIVGTYRDGTQSQSMYEIRYPSTYYGTVTIFGYTENGTLSYECKLIDCYPTTVTSSQYNWGTPQEISKVHVNFKYRYFIDRSA